MFTDFLEDIFFTKIKKDGDMIKNVLKNLHLRKILVRFVSEMIK